MTRSVVASFDNLRDAQRVFEDLRAAGFGEDDISIIAGDVDSGYRTEPPTRAAAAAERPNPAVRTDTGKGAAAGAATGGVLGGAAGLAVALMGLTIPGIGPIVAAGPLAAALTGAGIGAVAGGLIGSLKNAGVPESDAHLYAEVVRRGGAIVLVRANDGQAERAARLMRAQGAIDIDSRTERWRAAGWTREAGSAEVQRVENDKARAGGLSVANPVGADAGMTSPPGDFPLGASPATRVSARADMEADRAMLDATRAARGVFASSAGSHDDADDPYRAHFDQHFNERGAAGFEAYRPAYRYGEELSRDERYRERDWSEIEPAAQQEWESRHGSGWGRFKEAVRHAWERTRGTAERALPGGNDRGTR